MGRIVTRSGAAAAALAAVVASGVLALPASAFRDDVELVSQATGGAPADGPSTEPTVSADGRLVAFASLARSLSTADLDATQDVFLRDVVNGTTTLVSRASGPAGAAGALDSGAPAISADGRHVAFASQADNLSDDDLDGTWDVFVRDTLTGGTTLVSRADGPAGEGADASSFGPSISADGRHVAFHSLAANLSPDDAPGFDVFLRDTLTGTTTLVSRATGAAGAAGDGPSTDAAISADGRRVAFASGAANLSADDVDAVASRVLVRDLDDATTTLVSRATGADGAPAEASAIAPAISADGRRVAFASPADELSPDDRAGTSDVFVRDLAAVTTTLVSRAPGPMGAAGDGPSAAPTISADGSRVAFASGAANLSAQDDDTHDDVFLRDTGTGATILVSRGPGEAGAPSDAGSREPALSGDAVFVAFATEADGLAPGADPLVTNVVRRDVLGAPAPVAVPSPASAPAPVVVAPPSSASAAAGVRCAGVPATIVGTARRDVIRGTSRRDVIAALGGDDLVLGRGGNDLICLGRGADRGVGGMGSDTVLGGPGGDRIEGATGRDLLKGGAGGDRMRGGAGRDRLIGGKGRDVAIGGRGRDVCGAERRAACELPRRYGLLR